MAKSLNCELGLTVEPCGICSNCVSITSGKHPDVFEFDAASNRGIDDAKELLSGIVYEPITARKKIYIIDEVHMMTKEAFSSLLKTLEEPIACRLWKMSQNFIHLVLVGYDASILQH